MNWIDVNDQLPDDGCQVLVWVDGDMTSYPLLGFIITDRQGELHFSPDSYKTSWGCHPRKWAYIITPDGQQHS